MNSKFRANHAVGLVFYGLTGPGAPTPEAVAFPRPVQVGVPMDERTLRSMKTAMRNAGMSENRIEELCRRLCKKGVEDGTQGK